MRKSDRLSPSISKKFDVLMENSNWFVFKDDKVSGPITADQLNQLVRIEVITPDDQICREGEEIWSFVRDIMTLGTATVSPTALETAGLSPLALEDSEEKPASQDRFWRVAGILFCASSVLACLFVGAVKSPPATVQYLRRVKSVNDQTQKAVKKATDDAVKAMKNALGEDK